MVSATTQIGGSVVGIAAAGATTSANTMQASTQLAVIALSPCEQDAALDEKKRVHVPTCNSNDDKVTDKAPVRVLVLIFLLLLPVELGDLHLLLVPLLLMHALQLCLCLRFCPQLCSGW